MSVLMYQQLWSYVSNPSQREMERDRVSEMERGVGGGGGERCRGRERILASGVDKGNETCLTDRE